MKHLYGKTAFSVGQAAYRWEDVRLAAELWGDWARVTDAARHNLALVARYESVEDEPFTEDEADTLATEFRYERDLVTAEEMEAWLRRWDLDIEEWSSWITAALLRKAWAGDEIEPLDEIDPAELEKAVYTEALCSKALNDVLLELAGRAAVLASLEERAAGVDDDPEALLDLFPATLHEGGLDGLDSTTLRERMLVVGHVDRAFRHFEETTITSAAVSARLRANQTTWTKITYRILTLPREDVAREALLGVKEDGLSLDEVAADARAEIEDGSEFVEEFEPAVRDRLIASQKGELLGPLPFRDGHALILVVEKTLPSAKDETAVAEARADLLENLVSRERDNRVHWPGMS